MDLMMRNIIKSFLIVLSFVLVSCSDDESKDRTAPFGTIQSPVNGKLFMRGQSLIVNGVFTDDRELSHVTVSVGALKAVKGIDTPWADSETIELKGKEQILTSYQLFGDMIPSDIMSGEYYLNFLIVDKALNEKKLVVLINVE